MGAACCEVREGDCEWLSDAVDRARAARTRGECGPALGSEFTERLIEGKELVYATPSPVPRPPGESPELSWSRHRRVSLPWVWDRREGEEGEEGEVRKKCGEVESGARPFRGIGG